MIIVEVSRHTNTLLQAIREVYKAVAPRMKAIKSAFMQEVAFQVFFSVSVCNMPPSRVSRVLTKADISPMKVINKEQRSKSFSAFLVGVCAVVGGTLTVAAALDRGLYAGAQQMKKMKER